MFFKYITYRRLILFLTFFLAGLSAFTPGSAQDHGLSSDTIILNHGTETNTVNENAEQEGTKSSRIIERYPVLDVKKPIVLIIVLLAVIAYSLLSMITLLIFMLVDRGNRDQKKRQKNRLKEIYQAALVDYLDPETNDQQFIEQFQNEITKPFNRDVLINETIDLSINLQENEAAKLRELYFRLGLNTDSIKKTKSRKWHKKVKGYRECAFMDISEAKSIIEKGLESKNDIVRSEAQLALVRLNKDDPYALLDNLQRPFSVWEQNIIHEAITYHNLSIPEFKRWLHSENHSIVIFSVKMIELFDQKDAWNDLINIIDSEDEKIRHTVIIALGNLKVDETQRVLRDIYEGETYDNRAAILNALSKFKDLTNLVFFKHTIEMEDDVWLQVEAARGIRELGEKGEKELQALLNMEDYRNYQIIIKHVLDKRI